MRAFLFEAGELKIKEVDDPTPGEGEVVVRIKVAGFNRRDIAIPGSMRGAEEGIVLGSDGAGIVEAVGVGVDSVSVGDEVIINPSLNWETNTPAPPRNFHVLGVPTNGTFAEKVVISAKQVEPKPSYLTWEEAGVLTLSALTGYRALFTKGNLQAGETVFIPGAGSGVATFLIMFAKAAGARVIVTSRDEAKREQALKLGADVALDTNSDWKKELKGETIDIVIDSIGEATFSRSLRVLKLGGRFVLFGATTGDEVTLNLRHFFFSQHQLIGSTMGSREELVDMLQFMEQHQLKPVISHTYPFEKINEAFELMQQHNQNGKIAVQFE